jgi:tripartite-type tricarboxylate transporter receptor subunit TctC
MDLESRYAVEPLDGATRWSGMPDGPTMVESGQLRKQASGWFAVSAPAGTPKAMVDRLNSEFIKASKVPQLAARLQENGVITKTSTPEDLGKLLKAEVESVGAAGEVARDGPELMRRRTVNIAREAPRR